MPLTRILLVGFCLVLIGSLFPTPGQAQESYDTDYVVMFDTSASMNGPKGAPNLQVVKTTVREMIAKDWLPRSQNQTEPSRLYFYPFDSRVHPRREFDLTPQGVREFDEYVMGLGAYGWNTAIVDTLKKVLTSVPKFAFKDGRTVRRQYILLTDGEETLKPAQLRNNKAIFKLLRNWGQELGVTKFGDTCIILRVGQPNVGWNEIETQVKKAQDEGVPVDVGWTAPDPAAIRKMLQPPPRCFITPAVTNISIATEEGKPGQGTCTFNITGSHLPDKLPAGLIIEAQWGDAPAFTSLNAAQSAVTAKEWQSLVKGQAVYKEFSIDFAPPARNNVAGVGQLHASLIDPAGKLTMVSRPMSVSVTSKGKVEVAVSANPIRIDADRIDNRQSNFRHPLPLAADPAVQQNAGKVFIHLEDSWPNDDPKLFLDGKPLVGDQPVDLTNNQQEISIQLNENKGFNRYGGVLVVEAIDCQLRSGTDISTTLRIPWVIEGKPIPPALVTLAGELPTTGALKITHQRTQPGQKFEEHYQIAFRLEGAAGKQAEAAGFTITLKDFTPEIDPENKGNRVARDLAMTVQFEGDGRYTEAGRGAVAMKILIPGAAAAGEYLGVVKLKIVEGAAKFTAQGLGAPQKEVDLFWAVTVVDPVPPTVTIVTPLVNKVIEVGKKPAPADTPFLLPVEVVFNNAQVNSGAAVQVTIAPALFGAQDQWILTAKNPKNILALEVPSNIPAGLHFFDVVFTTQGINFEDGGNQATRTVELTVLKPVTPTVTIVAPPEDRVIKVGKEPAPADTPFLLPVEVVFNNTQVNSDAEVLVTIAPALFGARNQWILTAKNPKDILDLVVPNNIPAGTHDFDVVFTTQGIDLAAGGNRTTLTVKLTVLPAPVATVTLKAPSFLQLNNLVTPGAPWNPNQNIASIPIELDFNAEAKRKNLQVTVTGGVAQLVFSPNNSTGVLLVEIPRGQNKQQALISLKANDKNAQFAANGDDFQTFTVKAHIVGMPQPQATLHRSEEQESKVFEHAERGGETTYLIPVSWNDSAPWMGYRIRVKKPANVDLAGRDPHVTIETEGGFIGPDITEIVVLTRLSESAEPGTFNETWEFVGEGNLLVEPNEIVFTQRLLTPPMPMWKKLAYAAAAMVGLLLVGLLVNQQVKKHHGPPTFPVSFSCEWETSDDGDSGYIKATGKEEHTFGSGTDELGTLPITVTLKATKQQYGCGLVLNWEVTEQSSDGKITCVRFDEMNAENEFYSGENVSSSDRIVFKKNGTDFLDLNFHGVAESTDLNEEGELGGEDDDDGGDFEFEDEKEFTV